MSDPFLLDIRDAYFAMRREFSRLGIDIIGNPDGFQVYYDHATYSEKHATLAVATMEAFEQYIVRRKQRDGEVTDDER